MAEEGQNIVEQDYDSFLTREDYENLAALEAQLQVLEGMTNEELKEKAQEARYNLKLPGVPLPGPAQVIQCVLNGAWVFRNGYDSDTLYMQLAEVVVGCVGIPAAGWVVRKVAKIIWKHREKIAALLGTVGITAAQLAPFLNAPEPKE